MNLIKMPLKDQISAMKLYEKYGMDQNGEQYDSFWKFVKEHQFDGFRLLSIATRSGGDPETVIRISQNLEVKPLLDEALKTMQIIGEYEQTRRGELSEEKQIQGDEFTRLAIDHTYSLIETAQKVVSGKSKLFSLSDVISAQHSMNEQIYYNYHSVYGLHDLNRFDRELLDKLHASKKDPAAHRLALVMFQDQVTRDIERAGTGSAVEAARDAFQFYHLNEELYESLNMTTGDTEAEQDNYRQYRESVGVSQAQVILDLGTGEPGRMARFMKNELPEAKIIGFDLVKPQLQNEEHLGFVQTDITRLPLANNSIDHATAFWSVYNDLNVEQRKQMLSELRRVMKLGGQVYIGTPHLEGGEGSWENLCREYHAAHPDQKYGTMRTTIEGRAKTFYIIESDTILGDFEAAGFRLIQSKEWKTQGGKPRKDYVFWLSEKQIIG
jgi:ubiquinone/menaquinone biosynthesis C-methylase UbiE